MYFAHKDYYFVTQHRKGLLLTKAYVLNSCQSETTNF